MFMLLKREKPLPSGAVPRKAPSIRKISTVFDSMAHQIISFSAFMKSGENEPSGDSLAPHLTPPKDLLSS